MKQIPLYLLFIVNFSFANTYYVSNAGSDFNSGLSVPMAFETIQNAANIVVAGDTILVLAGSYVGFDHRGASGIAGDPIVYRAVGLALISTKGPIRDDGINIEGVDYIEIDGFTVNNMLGNGNGIRVVLSDYVLIKNNSCDNNAERGIFTGFTDDITIEYNIGSNSVDEHGIYVSNSSDRPVIRFNVCFGNNNIGIHMNGDLSAGEDGLIHDALVYGNIIHDNNQAAGINMDGCIRPKVFNNLIYNNHTAQGIALFQGDGAEATHDAEIYSNTIIVPFDGRWGILVNAGSHVNTKIYNNIIINNHSSRGCVTTEAIGDGFMCDYNMVNDKMSASGDGSSIDLEQWQALGLGLNSIVSPTITDIFKDVSASPPNYELKQFSPAIDAGTLNVSSLVNDDIRGLSRPQNDDFDLGAYEKIYCPIKRTISAVDDGAMYFAQDSIILDATLDITRLVEFNAPHLLNQNAINVLSGGTVKINTAGCDPSN